MALVTWLITIFLIAIVGLIFHLRRNRGMLEHTGLPIVKPFLFFGSPPYLLNKIFYHKWFQEKFNQLGRTFARYEGVTPTISTIDPDFIREVTVKQFDNFTDTFDWELPPEQTTLDLAKGDAWRSLRKVMTPTFTSGQLKSMLHPIEGICDKTLEYISEKVKDNPEIDLKDIIQGFTLDVISKTAFGLDTKTHRGENQDFAKTAKEVFNDFTTETWTNMIFFNMLSLFPEILKFISIWPESATKIKVMTRDVMNERDKQNVQIGDFIDRLRDFKKVASKHSIPHGQIEAQGMIFLTAGFETTANTIGSLLYQLATNPEAQEKVMEEILDNIGSDEINHESISHLHYLEACIMETLRMCPPVVEHDRVCTNDCTINGIKIKKGTKLQLPTYAAHYDPEFFPSPNEFKPERFLKENENDIIPYTWRPFGSGNRVCIGQRFAMMEIKIFIAKLLSKFNVGQTEKTELKYGPGTMFIIIYPEIFVSLTPRN